MVLQPALTVSLALLFSLAFWEFDLLAIGPVRVTDTELIIAAVVCLFFVVRALQGVAPRFDRAIVAAMVLAGLSMAASSVASDYHRGLAVKYTVRFFAAVALTIVLSDLFRAAAMRRLALRVLLGATIAISGLGLLEHFFFDQLSGFFALFKSSRFIGTDVSAKLSYSSGAFWEGKRLIVRASSVFVYCNSLAYFLVMVSFLILYLQGEEHSRGRLLFRLGALALFMYVLTLTFSRGAFATLMLSAAACGVMALARFSMPMGGAGRMRRTLPWALAIAAVLLFINLGFFARMGANLADIWSSGGRGLLSRETAPDSSWLADSLARKLARRDVDARGASGLGDRDLRMADAGSFELVSPDDSPVTFETGGSLFSRVQLWKAAWRLFLKHPWLGVGPDNYRMLFHSELDRFNYDLYISKGIYRPHNLVLNFLAEQGAVGGLTLLLLCLALLRKALQLWRRPLFEPRHVALLGGLCVLLIANTFDVLSFDYYSDSILISTLIALLTVEAEPEAGLKNPRPGR